MSASRNWSVLLAIGLCHLCPPCLPCGISTHIEIAHRALEFFHLESGRVNYRELLLKHQDAYQAGSVYPDSFYPQFCKLGKFHEVSEDTHWAPFLNASVRYVRENFPLPWEQDTEKLVAFLFGISSHMVADVSWHGLGIEQGFLRTMGAIDFHGSYSEAHRAGDFGGDVLSQFEFNFNYLSRGWYVPVRDLVGIYEELYGREEVITQDVIADCTYLQFLELFGEILAVSKLYPTFARKSPFMVDQFQEYFLGGLDDMAFWSNNIFHLMGRMLENGTRDCTVPENPLFITCGRKPGGSLGEKMSQPQLRKNTTVPIGTNVERNVNFTERGAYFSVDTWAPNSVSSMYSLLAKKMQTVFSGANRESPNHVSSPIASYFVGVPYARLGWAVTSADLNEDGHDDLVVGAPGYSRPGRVQLGRVYVVYANGLGLPPADTDLDEEAHAILEGSQPSGRFGSAVAVMDWNLDGVPDLAVGAPSVGSDGLSYTGAVYVFFGTRGKGVSPRPNVTVSCRDKYCNFGWTLLAADVDGDGAADLVVGSPYAPQGGRQRGLVAAFYSRCSRSGKGELSVEEADWTVQGEEDYSWFGYSLHGRSLEKQTLLLVGSPTWKNVSGLGSQFYNREEKQSVGKVNGYLPPSRQSWFAISGDKAMGKLGSSLSSGQLAVDGTPRQVLLIGASTRDDVSKMAFVPTTLHQGGSTRLYGLSAGEAPALLSTFSGDRRFSRFGEAVHLSDRPFPGGGSGRRGDGGGPLQDGGLHAGAVRRGHRPGLRLQRAAGGLRRRDGQVQVVDGSLSRGKGPVRAHLSGGKFAVWELGRHREVRGKESGGRRRREELDGGQDGRSPAHLRPRRAPSCPLTPPRPPPPAPEPLRLLGVRGRVRRRRAAAPETRPGPRRPRARPAGIIVLITVLVKRFLRARHCSEPWGGYGLIGSDTVPVPHGARALILVLQR